ncbi:hypothetical protein Tco_1121146 [Tanacetum coccineum]|uniref:Uncharacterized protein n=1 Tax=Tanacetum coccineum TaxID=301880 RepID=A0ABQ5IXV6_9ASTR
MSFSKRSDTGPMDLFAFIHYVDPTKVRIGEREVREGEVSLLELTRGCVVPLDGVNEQGNQGEGVHDAGVQDAGVYVVNEESGDDAVADQIEESDHVVQDEWANIVRVKGEILATVVDRAKGSKKKRKVVGGASGSSLPPKKLRAYYGTSGAGASTGGKSVAALQGLLERSTLPVEVGVAEVATFPFITSFVSLTPEHEGGDRTDSVTRPNQRTQNPTERFVVLSHSSCHSSSNAVDAEVSSIVRSLALDPLLYLYAGHYLNTVIAGGMFAGPSQSCQSALNDPDMCRSLVDHLACPVLFSQLHAEAVEVIRLRGQVATVEAAGKRLAKGWDSFVGQVSSLEGTCSGLRDESILLLWEGPSAVPLIKGKQDGLVAGIDHGKAGRGLADVDAYDPFAEANYVSAVNALRDVDFPLFAQLASQKDATLLSVAYASHSSSGVPSGHWRDAMIPLVEPLSAENLVGEASTSRVLETATTTALSTTFIQTSFVLPISVADYEALGTRSSTEVPSPPKIVFEKEELETTPEHTTAPYACSIFLF